MTGTVGYYFADYFIYTRPTVSFLNDGLAISFLLSGRRYFTKTDFAELTLLRGEDTGTGRNFNAQENSFGLTTYLVRFGGRMKKGRYKLGAGLDYGGLFIPQRDEYAQFIGIDLFINREF